jgi:hypothetical protein
VHRELTWGQFDVQRIEKEGNNLFLRGEVSQSMLRESFAVLAPFVLSRHDLLKMLRIDLLLD